MKNNRHSDFFYLYARCVGRGIMMEEFSKISLLWSLTSVWCWWPIMAYSDNDRLWWWIKWSTSPWLSISEKPLHHSKETHILKGLMFRHPCAVSSHFQIIRSPPTQLKVTQFGPFPFNIYVWQTQCGRNLPGMDSFDAVMKCKQNPLTQSSLLMTF